MQPRRRATTYGKASRKPLSSLSPAAADTFAQISFTEDFTDRIEPSSSKTAVRSPTCTTVTGTSKSRDLSNSPDRKPDNPMQVLATTEQNRSVDAAVEPDTLYDVPSSSDDYDIELDKPEKKVSKRRKITPKFGMPNIPVPKGRILRKKPENSHVSTFKTRVPDLELLYNDSMAQPTVDLCDNQYQTHARLQPSGNLSARPRHGRGAIRRKVATAPSDPPSMIRSSYSAIIQATLPLENLDKFNQSSSRAEKRELARQDSMSVSPHSLGKDHEVPLSPLLDAPHPRTPPRPAKPPSQTTTPHQRNLWTMLLPGDTYSASPTTLELPSLSLSEPKAQPPSTTSRQGSESIRDGGSGKNAKAPRRRRIVDTLQSQGEEVDGADYMCDIRPSSAEYVPQRADEEYQYRDAAKDENHKSEFTTAEAEGRLMTLPATGHGVCDASHPLYTSQGGNSKLTYARQRSYLTENDLDEVTALAGPETPYPIIQRRNRRPCLRDSSPNLQLGQDVDKGPDEHDATQGAVLRSIHELREGGGNVRLLSDIEALLEDLEDSGISLSLRRSRLLELSRRLKEPPFLQLFTEKEFENRLLNVLDHDTDPILKTLFTAAILNLLSGSKTGQASHYFTKSSLIDYFIELLDVNQEVGSIAKARALNMSRIAQEELRNYWKDLLQSNVWRVENPVSITPRVLALQCLEYIVRQAREAGYTNQLLLKDATKRLVKLLELPEPVDSVRRHLGPAADLQLSVSILESCTIVNGTEYQNDAWSEGTLDTLVSLLPSLNIHFSTVPDSLRALVLRLYINLTNNSPEICNAFSVPVILRCIFDAIISHFKLVMDGSASCDLSLDNLILALGFLINLAEWCPAVSQMMIDLQCEHRNFLYHLVELFESNLQRTAEVSEPPQKLLF